MARNCISAHFDALWWPASVNDEDDMNEAAACLSIGHNGLLGLDLERLGAISRNQITDFAPWRVTRKELDSEEVQHLVRHLKAFGRLPRGGCPKTQPKLFG